MSNGLKTISWTVPLKRRSKPDFWINYVTFGWDCGENEVNQSQRWAQAASDYMHQHGKEMREQAIQTVKRKYPDLHSSPTLDLMETAVLNHFNEILVRDAGLECTLIFTTDETLNDCTYKLSQTPSSDQTSSDPPGKEEQAFMPSRPHAIDFSSYSGHPFDGNGFFSPEYSSMYAEQGEQGEHPGAQCTTDIYDPPYSAVTGLAVGQICDDDGVSLLSRPGSLDLELNEKLMQEYEYLKLRGEL